MPASAVPAVPDAQAPLVRRLGFADDARVVILCCRGLGSCHAANLGVYEALRDGPATTATLMVPCPWARDASARYRGEDVGVAFTLIAEHDLYRWGPITHAPSLLDGNGGFPTTVPDLWDHADLDEVRREARAQLERAVFWGFDVSHLDSHLGALELRPEFFDVALELAAEFGLPLRLPNAAAERNAGFPFRRLAADEGVVVPDHVVDVGPAPRRTLDRILTDLQPGVTELRFAPAVDTPELRALSDDWAYHVEHLDALTADHSLARLLERAGVAVAGYRALRAVQRAG